MARSSTVSRYEWWTRLTRKFWHLLPEKMRLLHEQRENNRLYRAYEEAERNGDRDNAERLSADWSFEQKPISGRLAELETAYWRSRARRLHVPFPERRAESDENWGVIEAVEYGETFWHLTDTGIFRVRALIREEKKYRRESRLAWIGAASQIIAALTGVLGALIGLLSLHRL